MNTLPTNAPKSKYTAWVVTLIIGLLITGVAFLPGSNPPQCPDEYTQQQINDSNCIVGANIGAGLFFVTGLPIATFGILGLVLTRAKNAKP